MNLDSRRREIEKELLGWFEFLIAKYNLDPIVWQFALTRETLPLAELSDSERAIYESFISEQRKISWLRARKALSQLISNDTRHTLQFPSAFLSISHSGELALAFSVQNLKGVGTDIQIKKEVKAGLEKRFLHDDELKYLNSSEDILKLWSAKEALFKANLENRGSFLQEYRILSIDGNYGSAAWRQKQLEFLFFNLEQYYLGFAVCLI